MDLRSIKIGVIVAACLLSTTTPSTAAPKRTLPAFIAGGDVGLLTLMEQQGIVYKVDGKPVDLLHAIKSAGMNCARLRLWVNPIHKGVVVNDLPYTIAIAKRVKKAGLLFLLDIHYSDTWADPHQQTKPAAWANLPFDQLTTTVHDYTKDVITSMREAGAMPDIVQVGNEITGGMLWPDGKNWGDGHDFKNLGELLKSGIQGVKDGAGTSAPPLIMIHIDRGGDWKGTQWFFDGIKAEGVDFDIIGESYYPIFHGPMVGLTETLTNARARYHKPVIVVETAYPNRPDGKPLTPAMAWPETVDGQRQFMDALIATARQTGARGIVYWEPEWLPTKGYGGAWDTTALFDDTGNALPAFDAFKRN
jgi:arabinogalactan endo-1,4-beta-galactosidase